jgi:fructokinase
MTRFVVCGETLIDLVRADDQPAGTFSSTWLALSAGGPMNSAVALGRLGADTHFLGRFSTDAFGLQLREHVRRAEVSLDLAVESEQATSIAVVSLDERGKASYTFHFADTANFGWQPEELPALGQDDWLHIASLATVVSPGAEALLEWTSGLSCGISFDINVRPSVIADPDEYWRRVQPWLRVVGDRGGVLKASDEDVLFLAPARGTAPQSTTDPSDPLEVAAAWVEEYRLEMAVITLGWEGAAAVLGDGERVRVDGFPVSVVDTVGAGDTFLAGFLDGLVNRDQQVYDSLRRGAGAAAIVCGRQGAQPPTAAEVEALLSGSPVG